MVASTSMNATKIMRLGPAGLLGTEADCSMVKAGVRSCTLALQACSCVLMAV